jgi:hypothetical protein
MKTIFNKVQAKVLMLAVIVGLFMMMSCEEEDPFVDRHVAPVLIVFDGISGYLANGGLTTTPTRTYSVAEPDYTVPAEWSASFYELDKTGILDNTVGIDSIPVAGLAIRFTKRDGTLISELTTDADGKVFAPLNWTELVPGYAGMATGASSTMNVSWAGEHKGVSFTRYAVVVLKKS